MLRKGPGTRFEGCRTISTHVPLIPHVRFARNQALGNYLAMTHGPTSYLPTHIASFLRSRPCSIMIKLVLCVAHFDSLPAGGNIGIARSPICWERGHTKWANLWFVRLIGLLCVLLPALPLHLLLRLRSVFSRLLVLSLCCCGADYEAREGEGKAKHSFANENVQSHFCLSPS